MLDFPDTELLKPAPRPSNVRVRFRDLSVRDDALRARLMAIFERVLRHGQLIMGQEVETFEATVARYCGTSRAVGVASGTSAIYLALKALGVGPGDEVITTPMSWIATLNAISFTGATPVFADIRPDLNIDPEAVAAAVTERTRAIVPVHYTGRLCDMDALSAIAARHGLLVVEDAAQAMGAGLPDGRKAGGFGDAGAFSLNPMKVLSGYGDAGAITTNDDRVVDRVKALRYLGTVNQEVCLVAELNHKIDSLQAALLVESFATLDEQVEMRRRMALRYNAALAGYVDCPTVPNDGRSAIFFDYTVEAEDRDALRDHLTARGVEAKIRHPILMPDQPAYRHLPRADVPVARAAVPRILSLPCHDKLTDDDIDYVVDAVRGFYDGRRSARR